MREFSIALTGLSAVLAGLAFMAWIFVLPTIGLLWLFGGLK